MQYLVRFVHAHETFRQPEANALAELAGLELCWHSYSHDSPFAIVSFKDQKNTTKAAQALAARSILISSVHELWGTGTSYEELHKDVTTRTSTVWTHFQSASFRFDIDSYRGSRSNEERHGIIETFSYMDFQGPITMKNPDCSFVVFEDYALLASTPHTVHLGRLVAESGRKAMTTYNLKKRKYIATTSMDAELSLITANIAMAGPGKVAYDPFMGTGSFPLACACYGAITFGSDLDGRSIRGKGDRSVLGNFKQYGTSSQYLGGFSADITNTPLAPRRILDTIICDPPYGVREGLKVLGHVKEKLQTEVLLKDGTPAHLQEGYVAPKRPYSFIRMLDDILDFSATRLVDNGRLAMWMPVAGTPDDSESTEEPAEYAIPQHPCLILSSLCQQDFNKWSRRLLTYRRRRDSEIDQAAWASHREKRAMLTESLQGNADDLNDFRRKYFAGFRKDDQQT